MRFFKTNSTQLCADELTTAFDHEVTPGTAHHRWWRWSLWPTRPLTTEAMVAALRAAGG